MLCQTLGESVLNHYLLFGVFIYHLAGLKGSNAGPCSMESILSFHTLFDTFS